MMLPASLFPAPTQAGVAHRPGSAGMVAGALTPAQQRQPLVSLNGLPGQAAPGIKQEAAEHQVHARHSAAGVHYRGANF